MITLKEAYKIACKHAFAGAKVKKNAEELDDCWVFSFDWGQEHVVLDTNLIAVFKADGKTDTVFYPFWADRLKKAKFVTVED